MSFPSTLEMPLELKYYAQAVHDAYLLTTRPLPADPDLAADERQNRLVAFGDATSAFNEARDALYVERLKEAGLAWCGFHHHTAPIKAIRTIWIVSITDAGNSCGYHVSDDVRTDVVSSCETPKPVVHSENGVAYYWQEEPSIERVWDILHPRISKPDHGWMPVFDDKRDLPFHHNSPDVLARGIPEVMPYTPLDYRHRYVSPQELTF